MGGILGSGFSDLAGQLGQFTQAQEANQIQNSEGNTAYSNAVSQQQTTQSSILHGSSAAQGIQANATKEHQSIEKTWAESVSSAV